MKQYDKLYHSEKDCRNDHPTLNKVPVGFMGFHVEDYEEQIVDTCQDCESTHNEDLCLCQCHYNKELTFTICGHLSNHWICKEQWYKGLRDECCSKSKPHNCSKKVYMFFANSIGIKENIYLNLLYPCNCSTCLEVE